jgi:hypothetical protein
MIIKGFAGSRSVLSGVLRIVSDGWTQPYCRIEEQIALASERADRPPETEVSKAYHFWPP